MVVTGLIEKIKSNQLLLLYVFIVLCFIVPRAFFYTYVPVPGIDADSMTYWDVVYDILNGQMPLFNIRTPLYPLFLAFCTKVGISTKGVMLIQGLIFLRAIFYAVKVAQKYYASWIVPIGIISGLVMLFDPIIRFETEILPESIYMSLIIVSAFTLVEAIKTMDIKYFIRFSFIVGIITLLRPSGLFYVPLMILMIIFLGIHFKSIKPIVRFITPLLSLYVAVSVYNGISLDAFTVSPWGGVNFMSTTLGYVNTDDSLPESFNKHLEAHILPLQTQHHKDLLENSWNEPELSAMFYDQYYWNVNFAYQVMEGIDYRNSEAVKEKLGHFSKVAKNAVSEHPSYFVKFFYASLVAHHKKFAKQNYAFFPSIIGMRRDWIKEHCIEGIDRGLFSNGKIDPAVIKLAHNNWCAEVDKVLANDYVEMKSNVLFRIYDFINFKTSGFLHSIVFVWLYLLIMVFAIFKTIQSRIKDYEAVLILGISLIVLLSLVLSSLVELPLKRYVYPVEYLVYIVGFLGMKYIVDLVRSGNVWNYRNNRA